MRMTALRKALLVIGLLAGAGFAAPMTASADDITIQTALGEVSLAAQPERVIVFDVASLDTLAALGVEPLGVPRWSYSGYLDAFNADRFEKVGSLQEPDLEAVNALEPDLIIIGGRSRTQHGALSGIAPTIDMTVDPDRFLASVEERTRDLAALFGKEAEAEVLIGKLQTSIAELKEKTGVVERGLVVLTTGNNMSAYGPGSRFGMLHSDFGVRPAREDLDTATHGEAISFEFIAEVNPDWLFVVDRDAAIGRGAAAAMLDNELVARTDAWRNGNVIYLTPATWYVIGGGIQAMQHNVDELNEAFSAAD